MRAGRLALLLSGALSGSPVQAGPDFDQYVASLKEQALAARAGAYFDFECFLLKNGALYFITQQKKSFFSEIFNVVRLMDEKQTKYAPALAGGGHVARDGECGLCGCTSC